MKNIRTLIITAAVAMATTTALAGQCQNTTEKCGTTVTKPLKGYGHQCTSYEVRCGGCGQKTNNGHGNNADGVDSSNPGNSKTGQDSDDTKDDEKKWWKWWD